MRKVLIQGAVVMALIAAGIVVQMHYAPLSYAGDPVNGPPSSPSKP